MNFQGFLINLCDKYESQSDISQIKQVLNISHYDMLIYSFWVYDPFFDVK